MDRIPQPDDWAEIEIVVPEGYTVERRKVQPETAENESA